MQGDMGVPGLPGIQGPAVRNFYLCTVLLQLSVESWAIIEQHVPSTEIQL